MIKNPFLIAIASFALTGILGFFQTPVFASDGTIDATYKYAWSENLGWLNFGTSEGDVHVTDSALTGYAWGENTGWISLNCSNTSSCGTVDYKVANDGSGTLSGYAWGENVGWINFNPTYGGVTINSSGDFLGYAWGENTGWISFNCANTSSCGTVDYKVKTTWVGGSPPSGDESTVQVTIGNTIPLASGVSLNSGGAITLTENTTTSVNVSGTVTDNNGCLDLQSVAVVIYKQGTHCDAPGDVDNDTCYYYIDNSPSTSATCAGASDLTYATSTNFQVQYYADPGTWVAEVIPSDESLGTASTDTQTLNELQAIDVSSSISYGTVAAGENSTGDHTAAVTNTGNAAIDIQI